MAYGRKYTPRKSPRSTPRKSPRTPRATPRRNYRKKMPMVSFAKKVNQIIARNVENKYSDTILYKAPVMTNVTDTDSGGSVTFNSMYFYTWAPGNNTNGMTTISQGSAVNQRNGNKIKIKRWIIKGIIQPNDAFDNAPTPPATPLGTGRLINTLTGYVDIYFGKLTLNTTFVPNTLQSFLQSGATDITPSGNVQEQLYNINRDLYKIYYHKRFKMGATSGTLLGGNIGQSTPLLGPSLAQSNDFDLTRSFGFDVTKYVLKNHSLKYDEISTIAMSADMENLTLFAVFHPAVGSVSPTTPTVANASQNSKSFYEINAMSYFEYEDA